MPQKWLPSPTRTVTFVQSGTLQMEELRKWNWSSPDGQDQKGPCGTLMSSCSDKKVTWAFNYKEDLVPKRRIGHYGIYKKLCFRVRSPCWYSRGCKNERFCVSPQTPVTRIHWDVFCVTLVFTTEYVAPISIRKSINLFPTVKVTGDSWGKIRIGHLMSKGVPWPLIGYRPKGNCPAVEVAPGPNWMPCWVLDGDAKPDPCAPGVTIETSIWSPWVGETGGGEYVGGMGGGAVATTASAACSATGELDRLGRWVLSFEITCPHSFLPLSLVEWVSPWVSFQTVAP